jgi:hypothetical protein
MESPRLPDAPSGLDGGKTAQMMFGSEQMMNGSEQMTNGSEQPRAHMGNTANCIKSCKARLRLREHS